MLVTGWRFNPSERRLASLRFASDRLRVVLLQGNFDADGDRHRDQQTDDTEQNRPANKRNDDHDRVNSRRFAEHKWADQIVDR